MLSSPCRSVSYPSSKHMSTAVFIKICFDPLPHVIFPSCVFFMVGYLYYDYLYVTCPAFECRFLKFYKNRASSLALRHCQRHRFIPWSGKIPHVVEQLSPRTITTERVLYTEPQLLSPRATSTEAWSLWSLCSTMRCLCTATKV